MGLPKSILDQQGQVEAYEQSIRDKQKQAASEILQENNEETNKPVEDAESNHADKAKSKSSEDPRHDTVEYWRNRCNVVLGINQTEIPKLKAQIEIRDQQIEELRSKLKANAESALTDEERETYGEFGEFVEERINRVKSESASQLSAQAAEISDLKSERIANSRREYLGELSSQFPDWEAINQSEAFNEWLNNIEPLSGRSYRDLVQEADDKMQTDRVVYIFNKFGESGGYQDTSKVEAQPAPKPKSESYLPETRRGNSETPQQGYITGDEIEQFYADARRGKYAGRQEEFDAMEKKIFQAQKDGRVI